MISGLRNCRCLQETPVWLYEQVVNVRFLNVRVLITDVLIFYKAQRSPGHIIASCPVRKPTLEHVNYWESETAKSGEKPI